MLNLSTSYRVLLISPLWSAIVTNSNQTVLVFWGQGFDEIAASIFVGELRRLGIRVKLVGLNSKQITGQHGLALVPDWTLGQALGQADTVKCIIIPAPLAALQQFSYDPRLAELLQGVVNHRVLMLASSSQNEPQNKPSLPQENPLDTTLPRVEYPPIEELLQFIQVDLSPQLILKV